MALQIPLRCQPTRADPSPAESLRDVSPENDGASKLEEDDGGGSPTKDKPGPVKRSTDLWITASKVKGSGERERQTP
jgi:hypothetical protein